MQGLTVREPLDGANGTALRLDGKHQAGADRLAVEQHGAGAARAVLAARMRAGQAAFFPDRIEQGAARLQLQSVGPTIDAQGEIASALMPGISNPACTPGSGLGTPWCWRVHAGTAH
jgi:hypothetical protein